MGEIWWARFRLEGRLIAQVDCAAQPERGVMVNLASERVLRSTPVTGGYLRTLHGVS